MTTKNKFRFWNPPGKAFVQRYKYNGLVDELFDQDDMLIPSQYTGMLDNHQKEIWEGDIIEFERRLTSKNSQKYTAIVTYADGAYLLLAKAVSQEGTLAHMWLHDLARDIFNSKVKVIGNKFETPELI
jgi:uncharacterized phage protein (TIGR01671 family)